MSPFELAEPKSLPAALALLDAEGARPLSGGTALMLMMKAGVLRPTRLVSLRQLGLEAIEARVEAGGELRIGAMATLRSLERDGLLKRTVHGAAPLRVDYALTAVGASLLQPVGELLTWALDYRRRIEKSRAAFDKAARSRL